MEHLLTSRYDTEKETIRSQVSKAIAAIVKFAEKKESERQESTQSLDLLDEPESMTIAFSITRIPVKKEYRFHTIQVPHPIMDPKNQSYCLLVRDPKEKAVAEVKANELPIEKIIAVKSLKRKYASIESRKELANRFDLFFCEDQIFEMMGKLLGSQFFEKKKSKIPISLKNLSKDTFEKATRSTRFRIRGGSNIGIRIGNRSMPVEQLVDNAMAVVEYIANIFCPKFGNNVHNISVSATNVVELPVWSVPVGEETEEVDEPVVAVETPSKKKEESSTSGVNNSNKTKSSEVVKNLDIATTPVKMLKKVQAAKVEKVKAQLQIVGNTTSSRATKKARK